MRVTLANAMLRIAKLQNSTNPRQYLQDIIEAKLGSINVQNGQITSTTVNGKSMTLQALPGTSLIDNLLAAELALTCLERGLDYVPRTTFAVARVING